MVRREGSSIEETAGYDLGELLDARVLTEWRRGSSRWENPAEYGGDEERVRKEVAESGDKSNGDRRLSEGELGKRQTLLPPLFAVKLAFGYRIVFEALACGGNEQKIYRQKSVSTGFSREVPALRISDGKLFKTKLCILYQRGHCNRSSCSFAHGESELRRVYGPYDGRRDHRGADLRDRLGRRFSPRRRYSPGRDARSRHMIRGYSPSRSIDESIHSDRKRQRRPQLDGHSDVSGDIRISEEPADHVDGRKSALSRSGHALLEQLRQVRADVDMLQTQRAELEVYLEEQVQEADSLTSKIQELEDQLYKEKKEHKRFTSRIKKFVKAHIRHSELQEELKRSQLHLAKLGEQIGQKAVGINEDSSINIVSDDEALAHNMSNTQNGKHDYSSPDIKLLGLKRAGTEETRPPVKLNFHMGNAYQPTKQYESGDKQRFVTGQSGDAKQKKDKGVSSIVTAGEKSKVSGFGVIPPTGMAAHAGDELVDTEEENVEGGESLPSGSNASEAKRLPVLIPPLPPVQENSYSQYQGADENVDLDTLEDAENIQNSDNVDIV
ncbi:hypothetical protein MLD38_015780 [Melastoma candidum]|uniref:Uncharacterized protein n=1 Tax=Melastoma candidum TaxID=119954 RepID=A0ACB9RJ64_9MYRT|nr:hypothetical protein MLD38_015780 [Melastoma candidum]